MAELDAAPRTEPTAAEIDREETLLRTVVGDTGRPGPVVTALRRPLVRRTGFTLVGGVAAAMALVAVTGGLRGSSGPLSSSELASWTGSPNALDTSAGRGSDAEKWCLAALDDSPRTEDSIRVSNADVRGTVASMVVNRDGDAWYCLAASDDGGIAMAIDPVAESVAADAISLDTLGARGSDDTEFNYALGSVGADVQDVTVRDNGKTVHATLQDGRWTAWWPGGSPDGLISDAITLTLKDGSTRTVTDDELLDG
ncbi:hypothetical protein DVH02_31150 [Streptomyces corynorhini]|uniref:Uncharacterized protein n=1 Tax=Streptomyces corynorhini TaxID=2282652 RepID=A0A370B025_9ACTN|nr:hypothetical protein DVH02_31150 [Streptomyces corynorhini]